MARVGSPYSDELHAFHDAVLAARAADPARGTRMSAAEWYAGRSVFLTGGSGFLGRVLVEFLLRCFPDIGRVFLLLRPKRGVAPRDRLAVLVDVPLFDRLRAEQPEALSKVVAVAGDLEELSLGMAEDDRRLLCREVSVVFHLAASVRFDDPFKKAVLTNVRSTREVVQLARVMPQLKVLVHVSTAYCCINQDPLLECVYPSHFDWRLAIRLAELPDHHTVDLLGSKVLGFHPNTYVFTKGMAEQLMEEAARDFCLPVVITRPSIVMNALQDPLPGWMDNLNGLAGFCAGGMKGVLRVLSGDSSVSMDSIPVDVASKLILLASWARGLGERMSPGPVDVVNVTVGSMAAPSLAEMMWMFKVLQSVVPYPGCVRTPKLVVTRNKVVHGALVLHGHVLFGLLMDGLARLVGKEPRLMNIYRKTAVASAATAPFRIKYNFALENQLKLQAMCHPDDKQLEFLDLYSFRDTVETFTDLCTVAYRGVLKYVLKEEDCLEKNSKDLMRARWIERAYLALSSLVLVALVFLLTLVCSSSELHAI